MGATERLSICGQFAINAQGQWRELPHDQQAYKAPEIAGVDAHGKIIRYGQHPDTLKQSQVRACLVLRGRAMRLLVVALTLNGSDPNVLYAVNAAWCRCQRPA